MSHTYIIFRRKNAVGKIFDGKFTRIVVLHERHSATVTPVCYQPNASEILRKCKVFQRWKLVFVIYVYRAYVLGLSHWLPRREASCTCNAALETIFIHACNIQLSFRQISPSRIAMVLSTPSSKLTTLTAFIKISLCMGTSPIRRLATN